MQDLAEVCARDDLGRQRALVGKVLQRRAQQADAIRRQRALAKLVNDAQRPANIINLSSIVHFTSNDFQPSITMAPT